MGCTTPLLAKAKSERLDFVYTADRRKMKKKDFSPTLELMLHLFNIKLLRSLGIW